AGVRRGRPRTWGRAGRERDFRGAWERGWGWGRRDPGGVPGHRQRAAGDAGPAGRGPGERGAAGAGAPGGRRGPRTGEGGVCLSCGAGGRVALLFPGGNGVPAAEAAALAASVRTLGTLDRFGVRPAAAGGG